PSAASLNDTLARSLTATKLGYRCPALARQLGAVLSHALLSGLRVAEHDAAQPPSVLGASGADAGGRSRRAQRGGGEGGNNGGREKGLPLTGGPGFGCA